ncbi:ZIP family metal transporter [Protofrankia symbiont of Coriaria ruscifolia]|uniref:Zinc/iron permease n=1 Tax=Candidatus Protofrankia californiensis TaxID=1839754 RepID=A0A1C3PB02_9ACTN|nr:zinc permease [Protofrankia symbiont of Coriaria ruscifolia]SBW26997.1 zinc/iron permease [Candidatus Protofrankia californiensis]
MGLGRTLLLGAIAGVTILLGLPVGRLRRPAPTLRALLNAAAVGVLLFLVWDVLSAAWEPIDGALTEVHTDHHGLGRAVFYGLLFNGGIAVGLLSLVVYERWMGRAAGGERRFGPGAMAAGELTARQVGLAAWSPAKRLSLLIAVGIGLHNFAEGLAIGQSAASGEVTLATLLVIGFGLHNATEGFGIVAPLAGDTDGIPVRPGWGFLLTMGLIGGGPTFIGTAVGHSFTSEALSVAFLTLAAGSILYVVIQLITVAARSRRMDLLAYGILLGLIAGFATDGIVTASGA